ncbi:AraC family transcriptional regulator [Agrobacterium salinitolerans]|uniref:AraC family transcriptional regulator n=1 Tax=Agrobacterium sp. TaxID=361 RepID=UPI00289BA07E|nr:AraC family transcriptional regulator [Agrobacterium sp.]
MDPLSRLLSLNPVRTVLDLHCKVGAPWIIENGASSPNSVPYHLIVAGQAKLDSGGSIGTRLYEGDVVLFPHGAAHRLYVGDAGAATSLRNAKDESVLQVITNDGHGERTELLCGQFIFNSGSSGFLASFPEVIIVRTKGRRDCVGLLSVMTMLKAEAETLLPGGTAVVAQLSSALFALLIRAWLEQDSSVDGFFALLTEPKLQGAVHAMFEMPQKQWSLESLAQTCHMSRATFARVFRDVVGTTPANLLLHLRMAHAAVQLERSHTAVAEVGEGVGYQSEAAFNRAFKRTYGIGPGQYRRAMSK